MDYNPLVSIIIPTYNQYDISGTINALLDQTYNNIEIIVIDDSSNNNNNIIQQLEPYKSVKLIQNEKNLGTSRNYNKGIEISNGEIVAFTDDDSVPDQNWLESCIDIMTRNSVEIVGTRVIDEEEDVKTNMPKIVTKIIKSKVGKFFRRIIYFKNERTGVFHNNGFLSHNFNSDYEGKVDWITGSSFVFNKKVVDLKFDENLFYYCEPDFCFRASLKGAKVFFTSKVLIRNRRTGPRSNIERKPYQKLKYNKSLQTYYILKTKSVKGTYISSIAFWYTQLLDSFIYLILGIFYPPFIGGLAGKIKAITLFKSNFDN